MAIFHVKLTFFQNMKHFMSGEENTLKDNANMFSWKDVSIFKRQCIFLVLT